VTRTRAAVAVEAGEPAPARKQLINLEGGRTLSYVSCECSKCQGLIMCGRGLHSSTLQLNLSAFCVTGGAVMSCFGGVLGVLWGMRTVYGVPLSQKRLKFS